MTSTNSPLDTEPSTEDSIGVYIRPDRHQSQTERIQKNAFPLLRGLLRFRFSPLLRSSRVPAGSSVSMGSMIRLKGRLHLRVRGSLSVGDRVAFWGKQVPVNINVMPGATLTIGNNVFLNYGVDIGCYHSITVGNDVLIGPMTNILDDPLHELEPHSGARPQPIVIEDNVWLSRNVTVQPGVRIGMNSVVATGSVVTKDVPPNSLVGGVPAKVLRELSVPEGWKRR